MTASIRRGEIALKGGWMVIEIISMEIFVEFQSRQAEISLLEPEDSVLVGFESRIGGGQDLIRKVLMDQ